MRSLLLALAAICLTGATPHEPTSIERAEFIAKATHLTRTQTEALKRYTNEFETECARVLDHYRSPRARGPVIQALTTRFQNRVRQLMTPVQFARFEALQKGK